VAMKEEVLTSKEAAESLHVHLKTVYKLATEGTLPGKRSAGAGVISRAEILEVVKRDAKKKCWRVFKSPRRERV
jgi:excisionase family DNA binding protein